MSGKGRPSLEGMVYLHNSSAFIHTLIHLFDKYLWSFGGEQCTVLGSVDTGFPPLRRLPV